MKKLMSVFVLGTLLSLSALADVSRYQLPDDALSLQLLQGRLISVRVIAPACPVGAACDPVSIARIGFELGCVNELGPVTVQSVQGDDGYAVKLLITALEVHTRRSEAVRCAKPKFETVDVTLGMGFYTQDSVKLEFATGSYRN